MTVKGSAATPATAVAVTVYGLPQTACRSFQPIQERSAEMDYPFDLARFIKAQRGSYDLALAELRAGEKCTHWMWFIFPQLAGLGMSAMAQHYAISGLDEARAYLQHPVLGERLRTCTAAVNAVAGRTAHQVFGAPDDMKFRSSMTLFGRADLTNPAFKEALARYYDGVEDPRTLGLLGDALARPTVYGKPHTAPRTFMGKPAPNWQLSAARGGNTGPSLPLRSRKTSPSPPPWESRPQFWSRRPRANVNGPDGAPLSGVHAVAQRPHGNPTAPCAVTKPLRRAVGGFFRLQRSAVGSAPPDAS
ncbi:hypothetical protein PKCBPO_00015 [Methylorubrum thiocyanatum]